MVWYERHKSTKANEETTIAQVEKAGLPTKRYPGGFRRGSGSGRKRILGPEGRANRYHVMSRTAGGEMLFGDVEKEAFRRVMRRLERFAGVKILTYAVMSNHFHLLLRVPDRKKFLRRFEGEGGEERLLEHLKLLYSKSFLASLRMELADLREKGMAQQAKELLDRFRRRFCNLEIFVKELKERFSRWFNKHHGRKGTLWMDRYKSVIMEDGDALRTMAAYIDLNCPRSSQAKRLAISSSGNRSGCFAATAASAFGAGRALQGPEGLPLVRLRRGRGRQQAREF